MTRRRKDGVEALTVKEENWISTMEFTVCDAKLKRVGMSKNIPLDYASD